MQLGISALGVDIVYDTNMLSYVGVSQGSLTSGFSYFDGNEISSGTVRIGAFNSTPISVNSSGTIANVIFSVIYTGNEGATSTLTSFNLEDDIKGLTVIPGVFTYNGCSHNGDVDDNGKITPNDALLTFKIYLETYNSTPRQRSVADRNNDKKVTPADALITFKEYLGIKSMPQKARQVLRHIAPANVSGISGKEVVVQLNIDNASGIASFGVDFSYDTNTITFISISKTGLTKDFTYFDANEVSSGTVRIGGIATTPIGLGNGSLVDVHFLIKEGVKGTSSITLFNLEDDLAGATTSPGIVTIQTHGVVTNISLNLLTSTTTADGTITCIVYGTDSIGISWDATAEATFTTTDHKGTFTKNIYEPGMVGTWIITANLGTLTATATVTISHGLPVTLTIAPAMVTLNADQIQVYTGIATDSDSNQWDVTAETTFTENDPIGTMLTNIYYPGRVGTWTITGTYSTFIAQATVSVSHGSPIVFSLQPSVASLTSDGTLTFTAIARDLDANTWTVTGETLFSAEKGSFTSNIYDPKEVGTWTITATYTTFIATATVSVSHGSATKISISPQNLNTYVGVITPYSTTGTDTDGNSFSVPATFTITANAGTFTNNQFKAGSAGTYEITAHYLNLIATTTVVIQPHGVAVQISLQLSTSTTTADGTITCTVCGTDTLGISWDATDEATFTTTGGSGTFTKNIYNPCKEGIWIITTQLGTPTATATVTVIHGQPATLTLTPATCTLTADGSQLYKGTATDSDGNSWDETGNIAMWSTTDPKGTMIANIYYPGQVDTWTITGTTTNGIVGTATVNVTPGDYVNLHITAATTTITYATFTITVSLFDNDGNPYTGQVAMTDTTQSIAPTTISIIGGTGTATATITQSPEGGTDTITVRYGAKTSEAKIRVYISSQQGGTITGSGVIIGIGTISANVIARIATSTIEPTLPTGIKFAGTVYNIDLFDEQSNSVGIQMGTVTIRLSYPDGNNDGIVDGTNIREENLIIYHLENGTWTPFATHVNCTENFAWAYVTHFSTFTIGGTPTTISIMSNLESNNVFAYPNLCRVYRGERKITFSQMTDQATIQIFNVAGELIATLEEPAGDGDGKCEWEVPEKLATGVYIYLITNNQNQKAVGKIGIVK